MTDFSPACIRFGTTRKVCLNWDAPAPPSLPHQLRRVFRQQASLLVAPSHQRPAVRHPILPSQNARCLPPILEHRTSFLTTDSKEKKRNRSTYDRIRISGHASARDKLAVHRPHWPQHTQAQSSADSGRKPLDSLCANHGPKPAYKPAQGTGSSHCFRLSERAAAKDSAASQWAMDQRLNLPPADCCGRGGGPICDPKTKNVDVSAGGAESAKIPRSFTTCSRQRQQQQK